MWVKVEQRLFEGYFLFVHSWEARGDIVGGVKNAVVVKLVEVAFAACVFGVLADLIDNFLG